MFGSDIIVVQVAGFLDRVVDDLLGPRRVGEPAHDDLFSARSVLDDLLDFEPDLAEVDVEVLEDVGGDPRAFLHQPEQDVFGADVLVVEALRLLVGQLHHLAGPVCESFIHLRRLPRGWLFSLPDRDDDHPRDSPLFIIIYSRDTPAEIGAQDAGGLVEEWSRYPGRAAPAGTGAEGAQESAEF